MSIRSIHWLLITQSDIVIKKGQVMGYVAPCYDYYDDEFPNAADRLTSCAVKLTLSEDGHVNMSSIVEGKKLSDEEM